MKRVVTGNDESGKSYFVHAGATPGRLDLGRAVNEEVWVDDPTRTDPSAEWDPAEDERFHLEPPEGGSVVRVFTFLPADHPIDLPIAELTANAARFDTGDTMEEDNPGMHTTRTIDYGIVVSGEIDLELDAGMVHLTAGDVVVQRATRHAWRNLSGKPCTVAFVLIASPNYLRSAG